MISQARPSIQSQTCTRWKSLKSFSSQTTWQKTCRCLLLLWSKAYIVGRSVGLKPVSENALLSPWIAAHISAQLVIGPYVTYPNTWPPKIPPGISLHVVFPHLHILLHFLYTRQVKLPVKELSEPLASYFKQGQVRKSLCIPNYRKAWYSRMNCLPARTFELHHQLARYLDVKTTVYH